MELGDKNKDQIYYWKTFITFNWNDYSHDTIEQHTPYLLEFSFAHVIQMYFGPIFVQQSSVATLLPVPTTTRTEYPKSRQNEERILLKNSTFSGHSCTSNNVTCCCYSIMRVYRSPTLWDRTVTYLTLPISAFQTICSFIIVLFHPAVQNLLRDTCRKTTDEKSIRSNIKTPL